MTGCSENGCDISAMDVANFYIDLFKDTDDPMTKMRVMKFVYNAQGCSLASKGEPLFDEDIEAWKYGPVIPSVSHTLAKYRNEPIKKTVGDYTDGRFNSEQRSLLMDVAVKYGKYTTSALVSMSHVANGPWNSVYDEHRRHIKIPKETIREYFAESDPLIPFDMDKAIAHMKKVGYIDSEGYTVLPKDYDDS